MSFGSKISGLFRIEKQRLKKKGIKNILIALGLLVLIFGGSHTLGSMYWPDNIKHSNLISNDEEEIFTVVCSFCIHLFCQVLYFLIYLPGYLGKSDYYKKHEINPVRSIFKEDTFKTLGKG
eukprot:GHVR01131598.1.p1 GENE.GHVR01131598.1~~GHVR01131598.1.p1  ORF type:complete len:121 (+),score=1.37 GHVR01131598.1:18-380(+)